MRHVQQVLSWFLFETSCGKVELGRGRGEGKSFRSSCHFLFARSFDSLPASNSPYTRLMSLFLLLSLFFFLEVGRPTSAGCGGRGVCTDYMRTGVFFRFAQY